MSNHIEMITIPTDSESDNESISLSSILSVGIRPSFPVFALGDLPSSSSESSSDNSSDSSSSESSISVDYYFPSNYRRIESDSTSFSSELRIDSYKKLRTIEVTS